MTPLGTILIPAFNEGAVIAQTLSGLRNKMATRLFRIVVIANGCTDDTADRARLAAPEAIVIDTAIPGKTNALNLGLCHVIADRPVIFLDADLDVALSDLIALIQPLTSGQAMAACGQMNVDTTGCAKIVQSYYKAWPLNPYFARGKFGGMFALSVEGVRRVFPLPQVTADDEFIRRAFLDSEVAFVEAAAFTARAPRDLATLIRVRRRSLRGARAVATTGIADRKSNSLGTMLANAARQPALWPGMAVFIAVMTVVRIQLAFETPAVSTTWERDATRREGTVQS
jgi:glycosyltransferase involved in cell wall biosynthesis